MVEPVFPLCSSHLRCYRPLSPAANRFSVFKCAHHLPLQLLPQKTTVLGFQSGRPKLPLVGKNVTIVVGDPLEFDVPALRKEADVAVARAKAEGKTFPWEAAVGEAEDGSVTGPGEGQRGCEVRVSFCEDGCFEQIRQVVAS